MDGLSAILASRQAAFATDHATLALGATMRQARAQAAALVQLVLQAPPLPDDVGTQVSYRA